MQHKSYGGTRATQHKSYEAQVLHSTKAIEHKCYQIFSTVVPNSSTVYISYTSYYGIVHKYRVDMN